MKARQEKDKWESLHFQSVGKNKIIIKLQKVKAA